MEARETEIHVNIELVGTHHLTYKGVMHPRIEIVVEYRKTNNIIRVDEERDDKRDAKEYPATLCHYKSPEGTMFIPN